MTQTLNLPATAPVTTPVAPAELVQAADQWADVRLPDGRLIYPGPKLPFLIQERGIDGATAYVNARAAEMTAPKPLYQVIDVKRALENMTRLVGAGEFEAARIAEHDIWEGVLEAVASGNAQAGYLAAEALRTKDFDLPR